MTLKPHLVLTALSAFLTAGSALAAVGAGSANVTVRLSAGGGASVGRATPISCLASDSAGIKDIALSAVGPDGATTAIAVTDQIVLSGGAAQAEAAWVPSKTGQFQIRCVAQGMSSATASGTATMALTVTSPYAPVITGLVVEKPVVLVGKAVTVRVEAFDPESGPLRYTWTTTRGSVVGKGASATWTAPATEGTCAVQVAVTDDTGRTSSQAIAVDASAAVFQDSAAAKISAPRRVVATENGEFFVVDAYSRLHKLTKRGDFMATTLDGVRSVAAGEGAVFAGMTTGELVVIDAATARVTSRIALGVAEGPEGMSYDSVRKLVWLAFASGTVQALRPDGSEVLRFSASGPTTALVRVVDVAVDAQAGIVWVAQDRAAAGGMIFGFRATDGVRVKVIGADGTGPAKATGAIAVGAGGQVYVADLFSGQVSVVDGAGATVRKIGRRGRGTGELALPAGLAFAANGELVVANMDVNRLDRFGGEAAQISCAGDADCDGISDADEIAAGMDPNNAADALADLDGDGLNNTEEFRLGTKVNVADSDGDGFADGDEVPRGFNPLDGTDHIAKVAATASARGGPGLIRLTGSIGGLPVEVACTSTWRQVGGSQVSLADAAALSTSFVARNAGTYRFSLDATCDGIPAIGAAAEAVIDNVAPLADAGRVVVADIGARLSLSAAASSDANGDAIRFNWEQVAGPAVSGPATGKTLAARFGSAGTYAFAVTAADSAGASSSAEVRVVVVGSSPALAGPAPTPDGSGNPLLVAAAAAPAVVAVNSAVTLEGSASAGSGTLSFAWRQVAGPAAGLRNADGANADAYFFAPGSYVFELSVADGGTVGVPAQVRVEARADGKPIPVAVASAPTAAVVGERLTLDGSASTGAKSYRWTQVAGPWTVVQGGARAAFTAPAAGLYGFELEVDDGQVRSAPVRIDVVVSQNGMEN